MAFDGITIANMVYELNTLLSQGRISKIAQPEKDELLLTIKSPQGSFRLLLSADPSLPILYLAGENKQSPMTAPNFCMLLRKHIQNGRILSITQPGLERIIRIEVEHLDEMGDLKRKYLIAEFMGKHSNLIFVDENDVILDAIKHISSSVSSVREVLPGRQYFMVQGDDKRNPLQENLEDFIGSLSTKAMPLYKAIYQSYMGISPVFAQELCHLADLDGDTSVQACDKAALEKLFHIFKTQMNAIQKGAFHPTAYYEMGKPIEYAALPLSIFHTRQITKREFPTMSSLLEAFYAEKNAITRIRQRSSDLRRIVQTALERNVKKYDLQCKQMKDTEKRETYRIYGELLNTYGYSAKPGDKSIQVINYYTNEPLTIPLDETLSATENAKKYFDKYQKYKRTYEALSTLTEEVKNEIVHLESILTSLDIALREEDLVQIKEELVQSGYIRRKGNAKKERVTSKPFHYISSDGFHMYVGKNNLQNDELTFKFATGNDWWFHAKGMPGSHVVVKLDGAAQLPDRTFEEAGRLAAYYSKGREQEKVEIDYIQKKHVKKPAGAKPGFVIYYTNYSLVIDSDISGIREVK